MKPRCRLCKQYRSEKNGKPRHCKKTLETPSEPSYDCFDYAGKCQRCVNDVANQVARHGTHANNPYQTCRVRYKNPRMDVEECLEFKPNIAVFIIDHCNWIRREYTISDEQICRDMVNTALDRAQVTFGEIEGLKEMLEESLKDIFVSASSIHQWATVRQMAIAAAEIIEKKLCERETVAPCEYGFIAEL